MVDLTDSLGEKKAVVQPAKQGEVLCSFLMALKISMGWWFSHSVFHSAALEKPAVGVLGPSSVEASPFLHPETCHRAGRKVLINCQQHHKQLFSAPTHPTWQK